MNAETFFGNGISEPVRFTAISAILISIGFLSIFSLLVLSNSIAFYMFSGLIFVLMIFKFKSSMSFCSIPAVCLLLIAVVLTLNLFLVGCSVATDSYRCPNNASKIRFRSA